MLTDIKRRPSAIVLIVANLLPLFGVLFWGWSVFSVVLLYWFENLVLGGINVLKMITCSPDMKGGLTSMLGAKLADLEKEGLAKGDLEKAEMLRQFNEAGGMSAMGSAHHALKLFMVPFFCVHYFGFCAGHGMFVFVLFGKEAGLGLDLARGGPFSAFGEIPSLLAGGVGLAVLGLVVSHLYSFFVNYLGRGEYRRTIVPILMFKPYGRIVVLHVAIIFGGFMVMSMGSGVGLLVILIIGKIAIDLTMHLREHKDSPLLGAAVN